MQEFQQTMKNSFQAMKLRWIITQGTLNQILNGPSLRSIQMKVFQQPVQKNVMDLKE